MKTQSLLLGLLSITALYAGDEIIIPKTEIAPLVKYEPSSLLGGYVGIAFSDSELNNQVTNESFTAKGLTLQAGYRYNPFLAIEARYSSSVFNVSYASGYIDKADNDDFSSTFSNMGIYLKPYLSFSQVEDLSLYALLGYGQVSVSNIINNDDIDRKETGFQWGLGLSYRIQENISVFADYVSLYNGDGFDYLGTNNLHKADMFNIGLNYNF